MTMRAELAANGRLAASSMFAAEAHVRQRLRDRAAQKSTERIWNLKSAKGNQTPVVTFQTLTEQFFGVFL